MCVCHNWWRMAIRTRVEEVATRRALLTRVQQQRKRDQRCECERMTSSTVAVLVRAGIALPCRRHHDRFPAHTLHTRHRRDSARHTHIPARHTANLSPSGNVHRGAPTLQNRHRATIDTHATLPKRLAALDSVRSCAALKRDDAHLRNDIHHHHHHQVNEEENTRMHPLHAAIRAREGESRAKGDHAEPLAASFATMPCASPFDTISTVPALASVALSSSKSAASSA